MTYSDNEYGVIIYGDDSIVTKILNIIGKMFNIFKTRQNIDLFVSPYRENDFLSSNH